MPSNISSYFSAIFNDCLILLLFNPPQNTVSLTVFILLFKLHLPSSVKSNPHAERFVQYIKTSESFKMSGVISWDLEQEVCLMVTSQLCWLVQIIG